MFREGNAPYQVLNFLNTMKCADREWIPDGKWPELIMKSSGFDGLTVSPPLTKLFFKAWHAECRPVRVRVRYACGRFLAAEKYPEPMGHRSMSLIVGTVSLSPVALRLAMALAPFCALPANSCFATPFRATASIVRTSILSRCFTISRLWRRFRPLRLWEVPRPDSIRAPACQP